MAKKILRKIVIVVLTTLLSFMLLLGIMRDKHVQSFLAQIGSVYLSEYLGTKVWFEKFLLSSDLRLEMENVHIFDHHHNTLISAKNISADYHLIRFDTDELPIDNLLVDSAFVNIVKYEGDERLNINTLIDKFSSSTADTTTKHSSQKAIRIALNQLELINSHFVYRVEGAEEAYGYKGMDYSHLDLKHINIRIEDIHLVNDSIDAFVVHLNTEDKCGFILNHLEGAVKVWSQGLVLEDANIQTKYSDLHLDLSFDYQSWSAYLNFIQEVHMKADMHRSQLNLQDIAYFAPSMWGMYNPIYIKGGIKGTVDNLKGKQLQLGFAESLSFYGDVEMRGLPNIYETFVHLDMQDFSGNLKDLEYLKLPQGQRIQNIPEVLSRLGKIRMKGSLIGFYNDFVSDTRIHTAMGTLNTDLQIRQNFESDRVLYKGLFTGKQFDVGAFVNNGEYYGIVDFNLDVKGEGIELKTLNSEIEGKIDGFTYKNNRLNSILIDAKVQDRHFDGSLRVDDKLLKAEFLGKADFNKSDAAFKFDSHLKNVKVGELGLFSLDSTTTFSSHIRANFTGNAIDNVLGHLFVDSTHLYYKNKAYDLQYLQLSSILATDSIKHILLSSDYLDGELLGKYTLSALVPSLQRFLKHYIQQVPIDSTLPALAQDINFNLRFKQADTLAALLLPPLSIADTFSIKGNIQSSQQTLNIQSCIPHLSWNSVHVDSASLRLMGDYNALQTYANITELWWQKTIHADSVFRIGLDSISLSVNAQSDSLPCVLQWHNKHPHQHTEANIRACMHFDKQQGFGVELDSSWAYINNTLWQTPASRAMALDSAGIFHFHKLKISSQTQEIQFNGNLSSLQQQQMNMIFKNFNLSAFNALSPLIGGLCFDGEMSGQLQLNSYAMQPSILTSLWVKDFAFNGTPMGDLNIQSDWKNKDIIAFTSYIEKQGNQQAYLPFELKGSYSPYSQAISGELKLWQLPLDFVNPFLQGLTSDLSGRANGFAHIGGNLLAPEVEGKIRLERTQFRVDYLNTLYSLTGDLHIDNHHIGFREVMLYDTLGNSAILNGGLSHQYFNRFGVDLSAKANTFAALNTTAQMNSLFYGSAIVSGNFSFKGPFDNIFMQLNLDTETGSQLYIPLNVASDVVKNEFIIFTNKSDSSTLQTVDKQRKLLPFALDMKLNVKTGTKVSISMPEDLGVIDAKGEGLLSMGMSRTGNFDMSGHYTVASGEFFFNMRNLFNRRFALQKGGQINWTGDPYDGRMNMKASYELKTTLNNFENTADSSHKTRVPVECVIGLRGKLTNPDLHFKLNMPNTTEDIKQYVFSQIDTTNQAQMSQQMLSLLILNSFNFSNSFNQVSNMGSNMSGSTMQIFTNQIGNILSNISDKVDVGINYIPGNVEGDDELEVALSTRLLDDRISIDGNFGYQNTANSMQQRNSNLIGDITVEVKLSDDGDWRLKVFNKSNTVDLLDNTAPYTQGVGLFYRKSFNRFSDLFRRKRPKIETEQPQSPFN